MGLKVGGMRGSLRNVVTGASVIPDSGILQYQFEDEGTTGTATDTWNSNDGTISGAVYDTDAQFGDHSLSYSSGDYVEIGEVATPAQISVLMFVKPSRSGSDEALGDMGTNANNNAGFMLHNESGTPELQLGDGSNFFSGLRGGSLDTDIWQQAVGRYQSDGTWDIWIDNSQVASGTVGDGTLAWSGRTWALGIRAYNLSNAPYDGNMDNLEIVGKAVSTTEIDNHYNTGSITG